MSNIAFLAVSLIDQVLGASLTTKEADQASIPLLNELVLHGHIPDEKGAHIEWSGVGEFGLLPVCHWNAYTEESWVNVHRCGLVEQF